MPLKIKLPKIEFSPLHQVSFVLKQTGNLLWQTDRKALIWTIVLNILNSATILPTLYLDKIFIDTLVKSIGTANLRPALTTVVLVVIGRFLISTFKGVAGRTIGMYDDSLSRGLNAKLDELLGLKYSQIDVAVVEDPKFKDRYGKIEREGGNRAWQLVSSFADFPRYVSGIVSSLAIFIFFQPIIVLFSAAFLIPQFIIDAKLIKKRYQISDNLKTKYRIWGMLSYYLVRTKSYLELRLLNIAKYLTHKMALVQKEIITSWINLGKERLVARTLVVIPQDIFSFALDVYFAFLAITQKITIGSAQAYIRAIANFRESLSGLVGSILQFYENYLYMVDLAWFLDLKPSRNPARGKLFPQKIKQGIVFDHVWFKYPESDKWILKDVNFTIQAAENIALIGENGAGKTTLVKLLAGFYEPSQGHIAIDGIGVEKYKRNDYWKNISVLFQDFEGYDLTAQESIGYGNVDKVNNLPEVRKYAKMTNIDEWVESLPLKYQNPLSRHYEKGVTPSFGQWQRIGLARTLIKNSQILVLDEPTSNVDPQAEEDIFNQVLKLGKEKILIFISHRFSTVRRADKILLLEGGKITEQGTHDQLMKLDQKYARLFHLQAKSYQ